MNLPLNTDLTGKVAVVTGAAGTLCSVFSKALAASGAKVALLGRTYANVQKLADEITAEGGTAKAYECNVLDKAAVMACHEQVLADFGPCDILINGAGGNNRYKKSQMSSILCEKDRPCRFQECHRSCKSPLAMIHKHHR